VLKNLNFMKLTVISDIHGNLQEVLADFARQGAVRYDHLAQARVAASHQRPDWAPTA
jgi:hypothetical protein